MPTVPDALRGRAFRARDVISAGVLTRRQLASKVWVRLLRGIHAHRDDAGDPAVRLEALRLVLEDDRSAVLCGRTAAWFHGAWEPAPGQPVPLEVTRPVRAPGNQPAGLRRRRLTLRGTPDLVVPATGWSEVDEDVVVLDGVRVTSPLRTVFDLVRDRSLVEAVCVVDAFAYRTGLPLPLLHAYVNEHRGWPGIVVARQAVSLGSEHARSQGETRLRMVVVLAGFDEPLVNVPIVDPVGGRVRAIPDLTLVTRDGALLALEYDGGYHDTVDQAHLDRHRHNDLVVSSSMRSLRYDRIDVRERRPRIVFEVERLTGYRALGPLDDADFRRSPPYRAM